jgi:hypothetical protein
MIDKFDDQLQERIDA